MGLFWFDLVASFPGLITLERSKGINISEYVDFVKL
jgi:hypothetical protein